MVRVRFAPSPTGTLHLGAARTAVVNWLFARSQDGELVLRIDDTDLERSEAGLVKEIIDDLEWLGVASDSGPIFQSRLHQPYNSAYAKLEGDEAVYEKEGALWFRVPDEALSFEDLIRGPIEVPPGAVKDFVVRRSDGSPTYNFASAVDDVELNISHVLRGEDHISNTHLQILVIKALEKDPPAYGHLPLMLGLDGGKLSKRHGASSIKEYCDAGFLPEALVNYLAVVSASFGEQEVVVPGGLVEGFSLDRVHSSAARFDLDKLRWLNGQHIRLLTLEDFKERLSVFLDHDPNRAELEALQTSGATLVECAQVASLFKQDFELNGEARKALDAEGATRALADLASKLPASNPSPEEAKELLSEVRKGLKADGIAPKTSMKAIRAALTGCTSGPELHYFLAALGSDEVQRRLAR